MSNIHFINFETGKHEFCDMNSWIVMHAGNIAVAQVNMCKLFGLPVIFSLTGKDGKVYVVCDDESYQNPFCVAHEEGHYKLGHFNDGANVNKDDMGIIDDIEAEKAADRYAVEKTKDPKGALNTLYNTMESINEPACGTKDKYVRQRMDLSERMLAIANLKI